MKYNLFILWLLLVILTTIFNRCSKNEKLKALFSVSLFLLIILLALYALTCSGLRRRGLWTIFTTISFMMTKG
ncbi:hypothetical protein DLJ51_07375 [Streptococcus sobrinus]|uniref:Uncharacterized protein n=1 Tax=Streptococcus sobrinus TaxID=1310 RepID=A0ABN5LJF4_9STRE|nr:hypothetical protein DK182_07415 [Streptococcus sobrinus]AWN62017.1 hypothetical protein DLJ52_07370 [Streptococcus sobrinus]AWN63890.1 hypothetical protein DLJ51_07375 [Streptococcus sobrinus]